MVTMNQCQRMTCPHRAPSALVVEHPAPLNTLTEIFGRLNIAVGIDSSGQVVLARPDSLLAGVTNKDERVVVASYVEKYDKDQAVEIRERDDRATVPFETVRLRDVERGSVNGEERWTFSRVRTRPARSSPPSTHRSSPS